MGGGWGFSQSGSADSGPLRGDFGSEFGGINTGTQGLSTTSLAIIGGVVVLVLLVFRR